MQDKIRGAWAAQMIGVTYGGPTEFRYQGRFIPDSVEIAWDDSTMYRTMTQSPGLYDDIYMDLTFVKVMEEQGLEAPAVAFGKGFAQSDFLLWHANQRGRINIQQGLEPPASGSWLHNPHADDIDFQIEADFAGIACPGMVNTAAELCDRVGHTMNSGDGYYGGLFIASAYSFAYFLEDVEAVIQQALQPIPAQSKFHQTITDVIAFYHQHPDDWQACWQMLQDKWGHDVGCPDGALQDFDIDAKLNAAYVVGGLLYGKGDFFRTMDIATRFGQDSDCNPGSAVGILGAMKGYDWIPEKFRKSLPMIEDMPYSNVPFALNDVYKISYQQALAFIKKNGGTVDGDQIKIKKQEVKQVPFEENFPGHYAVKIMPIQKDMTASRPQELTVPFDGIGIVVRGSARKENAPYDYFPGPEDDYALQVEASMDGQVQDTVSMSINRPMQAYEIYWQYQLPKKQHQLKLRVLNPKPEIFLKVEQATIYGDQPVAKATAKL